MNKYKVAVFWEMYGFVEVEAENEEEALDNAEDCELPEGEYVNHSFEVDYNIDPELIG